MHSPLSITLLAKKGGVGKSTTSILLYEVLRQAGKTIVVRDWDAQGTSSKALELIHGGKLNVQANSDLVIYDTPPNLDHTATAVRSANLALIIATPAPADIWEAEEAVQFVRERNPKAIIRVVCNKVRKTSILSRLLEESAKQVSVPYLLATLSARECYQHAVAQGSAAIGAGPSFIDIVMRVVSIDNINKKVSTESAV